MSTRAVFKFSDKMDDDVYAVYRHYDGYPKGAAFALLSMWKSAWTLPRYEANEAAAAFVVQNKNGQGNVRLMSDPSADHGQEYVYEVFQAKNGQMIVRATEYDSGKILFYGRLKDFCLAELDSKLHETVISTFHGEISDSEDIVVAEKKAQIQKLVKEALDKIDNVKAELASIVNVGV